mmetsp:Transcript_32847/g.82793  ORF Transcript_32847/g.82793 Transcript_32847/m.82793 type:complete len:407 (+) Transcript_32847:269-1489(+)
MTTPLGRSLHTGHRSMLLYASISSIYSSLDPPTCSNFSLRRFKPMICSSHCRTRRSAAATAAASSVLRALSPAACRWDASSASRWSRDVACSCRRVCVCSSMRTLSCEFSSRARSSSPACSAAAPSECPACAAAAAAAPRSCATAASSPAFSSRSRRASCCDCTFSDTALLSVPSRSVRRCIRRVFSVCDSSYAAPMASTSDMNASDSALFSASRSSATAACASAAAALRTAVSSAPRRASGVPSAGARPPRARSSVALASAVSARAVRADASARVLVCLAASRSRRTFRDFDASARSCAFSFCSLSSISARSSFSRCRAAVSFCWLRRNDTSSRSPVTARSRTSQSCTRASASCARRPSVAILLVAIDLARSSARSASPSRCSWLTAFRKRALSSCALTNWPCRD